MVSLFPLRIAFQSVNSERFFIASEGEAATFGRDEDPMSERR